MPLARRACALLAAALFAACASTPSTSAPGRSSWPKAASTRPFRDAEADASECVVAAEACLATGRDAVRTGDRVRAAAAYMAACEAGSADGCRSLASVDVAPAAGERPWTSADQRALADLLVPQRFQAELGLAGARFDEAAPDGADLVAFMFLARTRLARSEGCMAGATGGPEAWLSFSVDAEGRTSDVKAAGYAAAAVTACLAERVAAWRFPAPRRPGASYVVHATVPRRTVGEDPADPTKYVRPDGAPAFATAGYQKPRTAEPRCVERRVELRGAAALAAAEVTGPVTVKFAVTRDGTVRGFELLMPGPIAVGAALRRAIESCEWVPGKDSAGNVVPVWVILPVRIGWTD
jgi:hypothetical protein